MVAARLRLKIETTLLTELGWLFLKAMGSQAEAYSRFRHLKVGLGDEVG